MAKDKDAKIPDPAFAHLSEADVDRIADKLAEKMSAVGDGARISREERLAPPPGTRVAVRRCTDGQMQYGGRLFDRNQVFELTGLRNDAKLVDLGYVSVVHKATPLETCGTCGGQFLDGASAAAHHTKRHAPKAERRPTMEPRRQGESQLEYDERETAWRAQMLADETSREQRDEQQENARAPLYFENTTASRS